MASKKKTQWLEGHGRKSRNILVSSTYPNKFCCIGFKGAICSKEFLLFFAALPPEPQLTAVCISASRRPVATDNTEAHLNSEFEAEVKA